MSYYLVQTFLPAQDYDRAGLCLTLAVQIKPERSGSWYNLACVQARRGAPKKALASLKRALENGFSDAELLSTDPDLASLREAPEFLRLLERLSP
jgi:Tfp pilus assembly protein PilF